MSDSHTARDSRRAGRGLVAIAAAKVVFVVTSYGIQLALPRLIDITEYGRYRLALLGVSLLNNLIIASTIQSVSKFVSEDEAQTPVLFRQALRIQLFIGSFLAAGLAATAELWAGLLRDASISPLLRVGSLVVLFYSVYGAIVGVLNGQRRFGKQAGLDVSFSLLRTTGFIVGAAVGGTALASLTGWATAAGVLVVVAFAVAAPHLRGGGTPIPWSRWLAFMAPVWFYQFCQNAMLLLDVHVLKRTVTDLVESHGLAAAAASDLASQQVAYYGAAQTFALVPYQLITALTFVVFPMVSRATTMGDEAGARATIRVAMRFSLIVLLAMAAPISGSAKGVLLLAFPAEYAAGAPALEILVFGMVALGLFLILATALSSAGRALYGAFAALASTVIIVVVGRTLVLGGDIETGVVRGAAIGTSIGMLTAFVLAAGALSIRFGFPFAPLSLLRTSLAALVAFLAARYIPHETRVGALLALVGGGLCYLAVLVASREVTIDDVRVARQAISKRNPG